MEFLDIQFCTTLTLLTLDETRFLLPVYGKYYHSRSWSWTIKDYTYSQKLLFQSRNQFIINVKVDNYLKHFRTVLKYTLFHCYHVYEVLICLDYVFFWDVWQIFMKFGVQRIYYKCITRSYLHYVKAYITFYTYILISIKLDMWHFYCTSITGC